MFGEIEGMIQNAASGGIDRQAAADHVNSLDDGQLTQHLQTAADNAQQGGQSGIAAQIMGLLSQHASNPQGLKEEAVTLITNNPQILQHFAPEFAKNILGSL